MKHSAIERLIMQYFAISAVKRSFLYMICRCFLLISILSRIIIEETEHRDGIALALSIPRIIIVTKIHTTADTVVQSCRYANM